MFMFTNFNKNQKGFTVVGVMVAAGVGIAGFVSTSAVVHITVYFLTKFW
jgi:Tfp pilus assembly major pilin PilA